MKNYLIIIALLFVGNVLFAQSEQCGTIPTAAELEYLESTRLERQNTVFFKNNTIVQIPVTNHIIRMDDGTGGLTIQQLDDAIQTLNDFYSEVNLEFVACEAVRFIDNTTWFDFLTAEETAIRNANDVVNNLNIYHFNSITIPNLGGLCGYTNLPPGPDRIMMANGCTTNGTTLIHEVGHYLSLFHTHGKSNCGTTDELVDGSNCDTAGDDVCDTPADPNLRLNPNADDCAGSWINANCEYTGTFTDANNEAYTPQTNNIMSYSRQACRSTFTSGQFTRARFSAINDRSNLICTDGVTVNTFPYAESFEAATLWIPVTQTTSCSGEWARESGGTSSPHTGPAAASDGSFFIYTEASAPCVNTEMTVTSPPFDLSGQNNLEISFDYHMFGPHMGNLSLEVSEDDGSSWTSLWTISGQQQNAHDADWTTTTHSLSDFSDQTILLRFRGLTGSDFASDMAIDNITITQNNNCNTPQNLAEGKTVTHSSQWSSNYPAERAVDGNTAGTSFSHTLKDQSPWWIVDIGEVADITSIKIFNRTNCCSDRLSDFHVFVSDTPFQSNEVAATINQTGVSDFHFPGIASTVTDFEINRTGRYIKVQLTGTNYLQLAEVQVFGCPIVTPPVCDDPQNIALGKTATQSSEYFNLFPAQKAVDGNTDGNDFSHTQSGQSQWWTLDLEERADISTIKIFNRTNCCSDRLSDFYVFVSDIPFISDDFSATINQFSVSAYFFEGAAPAVSDFEINRPGRYVRVQLTGINYLQLAEVQVFGCFNPIEASASEETLVPTLEEETSELSMSLYPNPASDQINLELRGLDLLLEQEMTVQIYALDGRKIYQNNVNAIDLLSIDIANLPIGQMYFLHLVTEDGRMFREKFLKM